MSGVIEPMLHVLLLHMLLVGSPGTPDPSSSLSLSPVTMLTESAFSTLPGPVRDTLRKRECKIPQPWPRIAPENVISGHFITLRRLDYAVLCSRNGVSGVLVINGTNGQVIASLMPVADLFYMQGQGGESMEFSRRIEQLTPPDSGFCLGLDFECPCDGSVLDAILDSFEGKASETHCYRQGWHTVTSGD
ncbi:MAG: hypothetical protein NDJ92_10415 [Thermoanaerobaculia bacterium]|nr:hypothetical protein [Thermoanaerobaculia bacterium]